MPCFAALFADGADQGDAAAGEGARGGQLVILQYLCYFRCAAKIAWGEKMAQPQRVVGQQDLVDGFVSTLRGLPEVEVVRVQRELQTSHSPDKLTDAQLILSVLGRPVQVIVEAKTYAYPRDLREVAHRLLPAESADASVPVVSMIIANEISPGGRDLLRSEGVGYWDRSASLYLKLPWAYILVDRPLERGAPRVARSLYRGSAAQVLQALLLEPDRSWHLQDLAARSAVSLSRVHTVLAQLEDNLWLERRGSGPSTVRVLVEPAALLDSWASAHSLKSYVQRYFYGWSQSPATLRAAVSEALEQEGVPYALTLTSGAELVAPFTTAASRLEMLVPDTPSAGAALERSGLQSVDEGENVVLLMTRQRAPLLFRQQIGSVQVASTVQLYLDLWASPGRGKEQARHLRAERLSY